MKITHECKVRHYMLKEKADNMQGSKGQRTAEYTTPEVSTILFQ